MVREMRVPSSSSSNSAVGVSGNREKQGRWAQPHTDGNGLDLDAILNVGAIGVVRLLVGKDGLATERVDKGSSACTFVS